MSRAYQRLDNGQERSAGGRFEPQRDFLQGQRVLRREELQDEVLVGLAEHGELSVLGVEAELHRAERVVPLEALVQVGGVRGEHVFEDFLDEQRVVARRDVRESGQGPLAVREHVHVEGLDEARTRVAREVLADGFFLFVALLHVSDHGFEVLRELRAEFGLDDVDELLLPLETVDGVDVAVEQPLAEARREVEQVLVFLFDAGHEQHDAGQQPDALLLHLHLHGRVQELVRDLRQHERQREELREASVQASRGLSPPRRLCSAGTGSSGCSRSTPRRRAPAL